MNVSVNVSLRYYSGRENELVVTFLPELKVRAVFTIGPCRIYIEKAGQLMIDVVVDPEVLNECLPEYEIGQLEILPEYMVYSVSQLQAQKAYGIRVHDPVTGSYAYFCLPTRQLAFNFMCSVEGPAQFSLWENGDWEQVPSPIEWYEG